MTGIGSVFTYMAALNTNIINFSPKYRGVIVGALNCFFAGSPSVFSVIYYQIIKREGFFAENFGHMMLFLAILFFIVDIITGLFVRVYKKETFNFYTVSLSVTDESAKTSKNPSKKYMNVVNLNSGFPNTTPTISIPKTTEVVSKPMKDVKPKNLQEILKSLDFYLLVGVFSFLSTVGLVYVTNLTVISKSVGVSDKDAYLVIIIPISTAVISISIGIITDMFKNKANKIVLLVYSSGLYLICLLSTIFGGDYLPFLYFGAALCGIGTGIVWSLTPTIMSEMFHLSNLGRNWGICLLSASLVSLIGQYSFSALYDLKNPQDKLFCSGLYCVREGLQLCLCFTLIAFILGMILILYKGIFSK